MFFDELRTFPKLGGQYAVYLTDDDPDTGGGGTEPDPAIEPDAFADERAKLAGESKKYRQRAQAAEARLTELEANQFSEEDRKLFDQLKKEAEDKQTEDLEAKGQYDALLAQKKEKFDADLTKTQDAAKAAMAAFESVAVTAPLQAALAAKGVTDVDSAAYLLQGVHPHKAKAALVDGKPVVHVVDKAGALVTDADCEPGDSISIDALVTEFLATTRGQHFLPPSGDTGSGAHKGGDTGVTLAELDADAEKMGEFIAKHGGKAYQQLVQRTKQKQRKE